MRRATFVLTLAIAACLLGGCTALLSGGKKQPSKSANLENTRFETHCEVLEADIYHLTALYAQAGI